MAQRKTDPGGPRLAMTNFERITASREALAEFLASLNVLDGPWDELFRSTVCSSCAEEDCAAERCLHRTEQSRQLWWLEEKADPQGGTRTEPIKRPAGRRVTLGDIFRILLPGERVIVLHRMGPRLLEIAAEGTVQEMQSTRCVEVCGDNVVEELGMGVDESQAEWVDEGTPVLVVTIGGKVAEP